MAIRETLDGQPTQGFDFGNSLGSRRVAAIREGDALFTQLKEDGRSGLAVVLYRASVEGGEKLLSYVGIAKRIGVDPRHSVHVVKRAMKLLIDDEVPEEEKVAINKKRRTLFSQRTNTDLGERLVTQLQNARAERARKRNLRRQI